MSTPKEATVTGEKSLVGKKILCPGSVFNSPGSFPGVVTGTPKTRGRQASRVYVQFENDDTEYWFPSKDVSQWLVDDGKAATTDREAELGRSDGRKTRRGDVQAADSDATEAIVDPLSEDLYSGASELEASEAEPLEEEDIPGEPGSKADDVTVAYGAEYGIPLGVTLVVLVLAGLVYFFFQLYHSEYNVSHSSIP